jgi:TolB-like protein
MLIRHFLPLLLLFPLSAETIKRRVLVLPFDNVDNSKNYAWMSESIADNLKTEILKTGRFEIMDVALLRKIDPKMQFANLSAENASAFAQRLNCEVAIVGRYKITKRDGHEVVRFEADGVDALERKSVLLKKVDASVNAEIFDSVGELARAISGNLNAQLAPLDAASFRRDNKLELLIYRLEHPPKGFLDSIRVKNLVLKPGFDIDRFEYDVYLDYAEADENKTLQFQYDFWGPPHELQITPTGMTCTRSDCVVSEQRPTLVLAKNADKNAVKYTIRFHYPDPRGPIVARWWVNAGYPLMKSLYGSPSALIDGGSLPLDTMRGFFHLEAGILPGRWNFPTRTLSFLPEQIRWSLVTQYSYANGDVAQYLEDNPTKVKIHMMSLGGGARFDRLFQFGKRYSVAPFVGINLHYQRYFRDFGASATGVIAVNPEIGASAYYLVEPKKPWQAMASLAIGSYFYSGQNLSYLRINVGVQYVIR